MAFEFDDGKPANTAASSFQFDDEQPASSFQFDDIQQEPKAGLIKNTLRNAGKTTYDMAEGFLRFLSVTGSAAEEKFTAVTGYNPVVNIDRKEGDLLPSVSFDPHAPAERPDITESFREATEQASEDVGYVPDFTWEKLKGDITASNLAGYIIEQGGGSLPHMAAAMKALPAYITSRTGSIAEARAQNNLAPDVDIQDLAAAAPTAVATALLERLAGKFITKSTGSQNLQELSKAVGKAAAAEGATEFSQEGLEYFGETVGTEKDLSAAEGFDRAVAGAVAGAGMGAGISSAVGGTELVQKKVQTAQAKRKPQLSDINKADNIADVIAAAQALMADDSIDLGTDIEQEPIIDVPGIIQPSSLAAIQGGPTGLSQEPILDLEAERQKLMPEAQPIEQEPIAQVQQPESLAAITSAPTGLEQEPVMSIEGERQALMPEAVPVEQEPAIDAEGRPTFKADPEITVPEDVIVEQEPAFQFDDGQPAIESERSTQQEVRYHGTSEAIKNIDDASYGSWNIYGQGLYTTDSKDIAQGYTKKGKGKNPKVHELDIDPNTKTYNIEDNVDTLPPKTREVINEISEEIFGQKIGDLENAVTQEKITTLREFYDEIRAESENNQMPVDEVQETFFQIQDTLESEGFGGIEHTGGQITGNKKHSVKIYFSPNSKVKIKSEEQNKPNVNIPGKKHTTITPIRPIKDSDNIMQAIAKLNGLSKKEAIAQGIDPEVFKGKVGLSNTFRPQGKSFDEMAETLSQLGYISEDYTANELLDKVNAHLTGDKQYTPKGYEIKAEKQIIQHEKDEVLRALDEADTDVIISTPKGIQSPYDMNDAAIQEPDASIDELVIADAAKTALDAGLDQRIIEELLDDHKNDAHAFAEAMYKRATEYKEYTDAKRQTLQPRAGKTINQEIEAQEKAGLNPRYESYKNSLAAGENVTNWGYMEFIGKMSTAYKGEPSADQDAFTAFIANEVKNKPPGGVKEEAPGELFDTPSKSAIALAKRRRAIADKLKPKDVSMDAGPGELFGDTDLQVDIEDITGKAKAGVKALTDIEVEINVDNEYGEVYTDTKTADVAVKEIDSRIDGIKALINCIGK